MARGKEMFYAVVGVGDVAAEKVAGLRGLRERNVSQELYDDFVERGRNLSRRISKSAATKRAIDQTKTARKQVTTAANSVTKAVRVDTQAARSAIQKVARAS